MGAVSVSGTPAIQPFRGRVTSETMTSIKIGIGRAKRVRKLNRLLILPCLRRRMSHLCSNRVSFVVTFSRCV